MAKSRQQKEEAIHALTTGIKEAKSVVLANFQGLKVSEMEELRNKCREADVTCLATKKTLVKRALADAGMDVDTKTFEGSVAAFFGNTDEVVAAKIVADFAKDHDVVQLYGGVLEGAYIDAEKVTSLAKLPSKEELLAKMVGSLNAPVSGLVNVMAGNLRGLVTALTAIKEQKA